MDVAEEKYMLYDEIAVLTHNLAIVAEEVDNSPSILAFLKLAAIKNEIDKRKNRMAYLSSPERLNNAIRWFVSCPEYTERHTRQIYFIPPYEQMETIYEKDGIKINFTPNPNGYFDFIGLCDEEIEEVKKTFAIDDNNVINSYLKGDSQNGTHN